MGSCPDTDIDPKLEYNTTVTSPLTTTLLHIPTDGPHSTLAFQHNFRKRSDDILLSMKTFNGKRRYLYKPGNY